MSSHLLLQCLILGEYRSQVFQITSNNLNLKTVDSLREDIKVYICYAGKAENIDVYAVVDNNISIPCQYDDVDANKIFEQAVWDAYCHLQNRRGSQKLSELFRAKGPKVTEENLHILVRTPSSEIIPLELNCIVQSKIINLNEVFPVKVDRKRKVFDLEQAIRQELGLLSDPAQLQICHVYKLCINPLDSSSKGKIENKKYSGDILQRMEPLATCFPVAPLEKYLHIIVEVLTRTEVPSFDSLYFSACEFFLFDIDDTSVTDRVKARCNIATERRKNHQGPPSTLGVPDTFKGIQLGSTYFGCARPLNRESPVPLALFHRVFGTFIDNCKTMPLEAHNFKNTQYLRTEMCKFYDNEDQRRGALCLALDKLGIKASPGHFGGSKERTDGHIVTGKNHPIYIQELKNELSSSGPCAEPSFQALLYYQSFIEQFGLQNDPSTCHPCFIVYISGPHIAFAGAALTERANLEVFSLMPLNFHNTNDEAFESLARHLAALKGALESLEHYYNELDRRVLQTANSGPFFPYPTSFLDLRHDKSLTSLTYKGTLASRDLLFEGLVGEGEERVCIKFVRCYGFELHLWCAEKEIAPKLIGFEKLPGGWFMVIMELLEEPWENLYNLKRRATFCPPEELTHGLHAAVVEMHQKHMVHGDIRDTNIMINLKSSPPFKLLDFDWGGDVGVVMYPKFVNKQPELKRPNDVEDGKLILADHDDAMIFGLFDGCVES